MDAWLPLSFAPSLTSIVAMACVQKGGWRCAQWHLRFAGNSQTELFWGTPLHPLEEAYKMLRILESQGFGHLFDVLVRIHHLLLRSAEHLQVNVLLSRFASLLFDQISEIVGRQADLVGKETDGRNPLDHRLIRVEILVEQPLKTGQRVVVEVFTRNELPFVKPHAVV